MTPLFVVVLVLILIALLGVYFYGNRVKRGLDTSAHVVTMQAPVTLSITPANAARAATLSQEPIFLKQAVDGVRVQLDNRPLVPLSMFTDATIVSALREIAVTVSQRFGAEWTALVSVDETGPISVRRLR